MRGAQRLAAVLACVGMAACSAQDVPGGGTQIRDTIARDRATRPTDCIVRLHGKGGTGSPTRTVGTISEIAPDGNADGWGARQWLYFPDERYAQAKEVVAKSIEAEGCQRVVFDGFSNGASFAAAMFCRAEDFDKKVVGYVIDDPVPDQAVVGCKRPPANVEVALYWTGGLDSSATPGADCASIDWTCAGGSLLGIAAYAEALGVEISKSPFSDHQPFTEAPELRAWLQ